MATRNIGTLTVDVIAKIGGFEDGMDAAERRAQRLAGAIEKTTAAGAEGFRRMAEQTQNLARLSETTKTFLDPGDTTSRWARNAQAFDKAHEAARKLVQDGERMKVWQQAFSQTDSQDRFLQGLRATAEAAGKTRAELLQLQATRANLNTAGSAEAQKLIAQIAATDKSFQSFNKTGRLTALELQQVGYQVQDFFVQVSSGQNILTAFIQQGAQLQGTFGGIGNAFRAIASTLTPMRIALGGAAATFGVFAYGAKQVEDFNRSLGAMQATLKATGRADLFPGLKEQIDTLSLLPGVTRKIATEAVGSLVRIPQLTGPIFEDLTKIVGDYARVTGKELPDAAKELGQAFVDPARGAEQLDKALGNLSAETLLTVKALTEQGRVIEAQQALYDELARKIGGLAREGMTPLQESANNLGVAWEKLKQSLSDTGAIRIANSAVAGLLDGIAERINYLNNLNAIISGNLGGGGGSPRTAGGARIDRDAAAAITDEINKQSKALLSVTAGYESAGKKADKLAATQKDIVNFLAKNADRLSQSEVAAYVDRIKGIQEQLNKSTKDKPFQDDAAQRELQSLREQEAALRAQLLSTEKLTQQQQELAKFEQQIADLKTKRVLTADQKVLLANEQQLRLQLQINSALSLGVQANEDARKEAEKLTREMERQREKASQMLTDFLAASDAIKQSIADSNRTRSEGYNDLLAGAGGGQLARQQILEQIHIRREFDRQLQRLNKEAAENGLLGSALYRDEVEAIRAGLSVALGMNRDYWQEIGRLQSDWSIGAMEATANYVADVADMAGQVENLFTSMFIGMEDALVKFATTGKLSFNDLANSIVADITRIIIRQQVTGPLASAITGSALGGGFITNLLGGLFAPRGGGIGGYGLPGSFAGLFANGGYIPSGKWGIVGEDGPELFVPRMSGAVIPAAQTASLLGRGNVNVSNAFYLSGPVDRRTQQEVAAAAARSIANASRRQN